MLLAQTVLLQSVDRSSYGAVKGHCIIKTLRTWVVSSPIWVPTMAMTAGSRTLRLAMEMVNRSRWNVGRFHSHSSCPHSACGDKRMLMSHHGTAHLHVC